MEVLLSHEWFNSLSWWVRVPFENSQWAREISYKSIIWEWILPRVTTLLSKTKKIPPQPKRSFLRCVFKRKDNKLPFYLLFATIIIIKHNHVLLCLSISRTHRKADKTIFTLKHTREINENQPTDIFSQSITVWWDGYSCIHSTTIQTTRNRNLCLTGSDSQSSSIIQSDSWTLLFSFLSCSLTLSV